MNCPDELIAQFPDDQRSGSRLMLVDSVKASCTDSIFHKLPEFLNSGDLLVFNNTRVFPARLFGQKETGGKLEVLVERIVDPQTVLAHVRCSKSPRVGTLVILEEKIHCTTTGRKDDLFELQLVNPVDEWLPLLQEHGHIPLPPYIQRQDNEIDSDRYQTVYASKTGAVAAPTAGLHFDRQLIEAIEKKGVETAEITLHVGAGTFQPLREDDISKHVMHSEYAEVTESVCEKIKSVQKRKGRVIAVGTTVVRTLESAWTERGIEPFNDETRLFIKPGYQFKVIDALITNYHLPKSTLLMLVSAFAGKKVIFDAYQQAIDWQYRFFSYGDAMFIQNRSEPQ